MKKQIAILTVVLLAVSIFLPGSLAIAQTPQKMSYQAVIRNSSNQLIASQAVGMKISILQGSATGTLVYTETQTPSTNANGLVSIEIGGSAGFSAINWSSDLYFIKTETDPAGGTNYTITGTSQLLSVPYALHAKTAEAVIGSFYLGKDTLGGIVYYIYIGSDGQQHGLIVSKEETVVAWQNTATNTSAYRTWDGAVNTNNMTDSPAKDWIIANFSNEWYLPSIDELSILWQNRYHVNKELIKAAVAIALLSNSAPYWSSTEISSENAFCFVFHYGNVEEESKTSAIWVRAIRTF
jgi:hypothetical protein